MEGQIEKLEKELADLKRLAQLQKEIDELRWKLKISQERIVPVPHPYPTHPMYPIYPKCPSYPDWNTPFITWTSSAGEKI